ncbi:MAG: penicillin-binding protein 2 [Verrucomicrobia bacterium]|nr:penicillin-binding protein 2 [Verrucomicrobiota bacterium]MBI3867726.1 penicillin-binding protein 2 [Verrucomicrobiota bacterium]
MRPSATFRPGQLRWLLGFACALGLALGGLGVRLFVLQVKRHDELRALAMLMTQESIVREPWRGDILDANGNTLARSQPVKRVCADPVLIRDRQRDVARVLSPILGMTEEALSERLRITTRTLTNGIVRTNRFVDLRFDATLDQWQEIVRGMGNLPYDGNEGDLPKRERRFWQNLRHKAVFGVDSQRRAYPNHELAAHVVGVVGITNYVVQDSWVRELVGMEGIESTFNKQLSGVRGIRVTEKDRSNRELVRFRAQNAEPVAGLNVVLSVDLVLQKILEAELAEAAARFNPANAMGVVMRPRTGDILALANRVTFDPNNVKDSPLENRRNRVVNDFYEPGSTFKVVSLSAALNERVARLTDPFDCERGSWHYGGLTLTDHEHYNVLPLEIVFAKSSNIGIAKMALRMTEPAFYRYIRDFGFGARTGIELPGEALGRIRDPKYWHKTSMTRIPIGYEVAATPLQMTMAVAAVANGGVLMQPKVVKRLQDNQGRTVVDYPPVRVREVIPPDTVRQVLAAMKTVVSTNGSGVKAMMDDYTVAGKTGTAWKWNSATMHYDKRYYASFIGFFPADAPELCISIVLDDPQSGVYGGQVAAPVFKRVAEQAARYLKIPPDRGSLAARPEEPATLATAFRNPQTSRPLR